MATHIDISTFGEYAIYMQNSAFYDVAMYLMQYVLINACICCNYYVLTILDFFLTIRGIKAL